MRRLVFFLVLILWPTLAARAQHEPASPPTSVVERVEEALLEQGLFRALGVLFDPDRATLRPEARASLNAVGVVLEENPSLRIEVAGHTDATGPAAYNRQLSEKRADAVRAYLATSFAISPDRLEARGYGETRPLSDSATPTGRALNRRVDFRVLDAGLPDASAPEEEITRDTTTSLPDSNRAALRHSIQRAAREALRQRLDTMKAATPATDATTARVLAASEQPAAPRSRWRLLGQPLRAALPYIGARFGAGPDQAVVGVRALFRSDESWLRLMPEASFGYRDGFSLHVAASAVVPVAPHWTDPYRPYVGLGAALFTERWLSGLDLGLQLLAGVKRELGSRGLVFGEYGSVDYFRQHRLIVGYRLAF